MIAWCILAEQNGQTPWDFPLTLRSRAKRSSNRYPTLPANPAFHSNALNLTGPALRRLDSTQSQSCRIGPKLSTSWFRRSHRHRSAKVRPPRRSASGMGFQPHRQTRRHRRSPAIDGPDLRHQGRRSRRRATARSFRWSSSTCTSPATCTPSPPLTTCARPQLDAHLYHGNELGLDMHNITWRRVHRCQRPFASQHCDRPRRTSRRRAPRNRIRHHGCVRGHGYVWRFAHRCKTYAPASAVSSSATPRPGPQSLPKSSKRGRLDGSHPQWRPSSPT